jgi:hypothetical protein
VPRLPHDDRVNQARGRTHVWRPDNQILFLLAWFVKGQFHLALMRRREHVTASALFPGLRIPSGFDLRSQSNIIIFEPVWMLQTALQNVFLNRKLVVHGLTWVEMQCCIR